MKRLMSFFIAVPMALALVFPAAGAAFEWTGNGDGLSWTDPANWKANGSTAKNHPCASSNDSLIFNNDAVVAVDSDYDCYGITVNKGCSVILRSVDGTIKQIKITNSNGGGCKGSLTLDKIRIYRAGMYTTVSFPENGALSLINGANMTIDGTLALAQGFNLSLSGGSTLNLGYEIRISGSSTVLTIDDSNCIVGSNFYVGYNAPGGGRVVFKGAKPVLDIRGGAIRTKENTADWTAGFDWDFEIPLGGYTVPPVQAANSKMFEKMNSTTHMNRFNVLSSSPALKDGRKLDTVLVSSSAKGIVRSEVTGTSDSAIVSFTDSNGAAAETDATANLLHITLNPAATEVQPPPAIADVQFSDAVALAVKRRTVTATYTVLVLPTDGTVTKVTLEGGVSDDVSLFTDGGSAVLTQAGTYSDLVWTAPKRHFDDCYFRLRFDQTDGGGTVVRSVWSKVYTTTTVDDSIYTWQDVNGCWNGVVNDRKHWACNADEDDRLDWPMHPSSKAVIPENVTVVVTNIEAVSGNWELGSGSAVTFVSPHGELRPELGVQTFKIGDGVTCTLDRAAVNVITPRYEMVLPAESTLRIQNSSSLSLSTLTMTKAGGNARLLISGESSYAGGHFYINNGNLVHIDNSAMELVGNLYAGDGTFCFSGTNPTFNFKAKDAVVGANVDSTVLDLCFCVPEGGFGAVPITGHENATKVFGSVHGTKTGKIRVNVHDDSPALNSSKKISQRLIEWACGFDPENIVKGNLPKKAIDAFFDAGETEKHIYSVSFRGGTKGLSILIR